MLAPLAVMVVLDPRHTLEEPPNVMVGLGLTVIVRTAVSLHPLPFVPVTVYVVVVVGVQVMGVPVVAVRPDDGVHAYVVAPLALIVVDEPLHIVVVPPPAVTTGSAFTVIARVAVPLQPAALVPVTV